MPARRTQSTLTATFSFGDGPSELRAIAEESERRTRLPLDRGPAVSAADGPPAKEAAADRPDAPNHRPGRPTRSSGGHRRPRSAVRVRAGPRDGSVPVNTDGAWPHNIAGEAYVVAPACFQAFAAGREIAPATVRNRVARLQRHRVRVSRSGAANLYRAVLADGSRVEGMVCPSEHFWDDDPPPRVNAELDGKRQ